MKDEEGMSDTRKADDLLPAQRQSSSFRLHPSALFFAFLLVAIAAYTALAAVNQYTVGPFTASTNSSYTACYTNVLYHPSTLRRVVYSLSAGLTNVDIKITDRDGTVFYTTNSVGASSNAAATFTVTSGAGVFPCNQFIVYSENAKKFSTNNAGTFSLTVTADE